MLIIDGPDMVGKTRLADVLKVEIEKRCKQLGLDVNIPVKHNGEETAKWHYKTYIRNVVPFTIQDRFHLSELIYGSVVRNSISYSSVENNLINKEIEKKGGLVIVCYASEYDYRCLLHRHLSRGELYSADINSSVNNMYRNVSLKKEFLWTNQAYKLKVDYRLFTKGIPINSFRYVGEFKQNIGKIAKHYIENQVNYLFKKVMK